MFKTAMLNLMYNLGLFGSVVVGYLAMEKRSFVLVAIAIVALIFFLMQKIKIMKQIKNMQKPNGKP
jgi:hypothetical protein